MTASVTVGVSRAVRGTAIWGALCLACVAPSSRGAAQDEAQRLRFAWPVPCTVQVREKSLKKGKDAEMSYVAVLERRPRGKGLVLAIRDLQFLRIMGEDASLPEVSRRLGPALAIAGAIPRLTLSEQGEIVAMEGLSEVVERALTLVRRSGDEKREAAVRAQLQTPQAAAMMQEVAAQFWGVWVGAWILDEPPAPGKTEEFVRQRQLGTGGSVDAPFTITHHGSPKEHPQHIRLATEEVIQGELAKVLLGGVLRALASGAIEESGRKEDFERSLAQMEASLTMRCEVITDPKTLQPVYAKGEKVVVISDPKTGKKEDREMREYWFTWK